MGYTVSDFYNTYSDHLKLIAGRGGLAREITSCGILDYELLPELKGKYYHSNFQSGQFIVSSLLYAKDNPYIITEAIKHLISKGASGLAIRNVLKIQIPEAVVRYADSKNFPIFFVQSIALPFETIIYTINRHFEIEKTSEFNEHVINYLLSQDLNPEEISRSALKLNPSFCNQFFCVYFQPEDLITDSQKNQLIDCFKNSRFSSPEDFMCAFRKGIIFVKSHERIFDYYNDVFLREFIHTVFSGEPMSRNGISSIHNTLAEFKQALNEMFFASAYTDPSEKTIHYFKELGVYRILFPYCKKPEFISFSNDIMEPIEEYDTENNTSLMDTLITYVSCDSSLEMTAARLSQHTQTIRYRMNKIYSLVCLNRKSPSDAEQLSLACKIYIANKLLAQ